MRLETGYCTLQERKEVLVESFFKTIVLTNPVFQNFIFEKTGFMEPLLKLNIFVGANSSGKSRALRSIYFEKNLPYLMDQVTVKDFVDLAKKIQQKIILAMGRYSLISGVTEDYLSEIINWNTDFNDPNRLIHEILKQKIQPLSTISFTGYRERPNDYQHKSESVIIDELKNIYEEYWNLILAMSEKNTPAFSKRIYFPVLRGMRPFHNNENFYLKKTLSDYFKVDSLREGQEIFTGLELYRSLKNKLLGEPEDREEIINYETFLANTFLKARQSH